MQNGADETFRIGQGVCFPTGMRPFEDFFVLVQVCFKLIKKSKHNFTCAMKTIIIQLQNRRLGDGLGILLASCLDRTSTRPEARGPQRIYPSITTNSKSAFAPGSWSGQSVVQKEVR